MVCLFFNYKKATMDYDFDAPFVWDENEDRQLLGALLGDDGYSGKTVMQRLPEVSNFQDSPFGTDWDKRFDAGPGNLLGEGRLNY